MEPRLNKPPKSSKFVMAIYNMDRCDRRGDLNRAKYWDKVSRRIAKQRGRIKRKEARMKINDAHHTNNT